MLREGGVPSPVVAADARLVDGVVAMPVTTVAPVSDAVDAAEGVVDTTLATVAEVGQRVASASESLSAVTAQLLETVDQTAVDVLDNAGASMPATTVEPVPDGTAAVVTSGVVEPLAGLVADATVGTPTLLGLTPYP
jgi:hypothetical protein